MNEKKIRPWIYIFVTLFHFILILFIVFETDIKIIPVTENNRVIRLINLEEISPEPQLQAQAPVRPQLQAQAQMQPETEPPTPSVLPVIISSEPDDDDDKPEVESIAEVMIETDIPPAQTVVAPGAHMIPSVDSAANTAIGAAQNEENFLTADKLSVLPEFDVNAILSDLVYPAIALRSGIEGRVILELFVDRTGTVQRVTVLREEPEGRGFGEAAVRAFTGRMGSPAIVNGEPVSARYRYPLSFRIR